MGKVIIASDSFKSSSNFYSKFIFTFMDSFSNVIYKWRKHLDSYALTIYKYFHILACICDI